ncbi:MAG: M20 family metallopeptidase [Candidatus Atabeyarchaeum deiterrae]
MSDLDYELGLLEKLVSLDTDSNEKRNYEECSRLISGEAKSAGLKAEILDGIEVLKDDKRPRPNVIVDLDKNSDTTLLLVTHFDIVPPGGEWTHDPFKLTIENDKAYGRGASDDKGAIVSCLGALSKLADDKTADVNVKLIITCDEEVGGEAGIEYLTDRVKIRGDAALVVDSGPEYVSCGASGVIWGKIKVKGKQGHAGYPHRAVNAIEEALRMLSSIQDYKKKLASEKSKLRAPPDSPEKNVWRRLTVTMIHAGEKENIIPGECEIRFDLRALPDEDFNIIKGNTERFITNEIRKKGLDAEFQIVHSMSGYYTDPNHPLLRSLVEATRKVSGHELPVAADLGGNDGTFLARVGVPVACFGPLREGTNYHGKDEFVYPADIAFARDVIVKLCQEGRSKLKR